jgi:hypothetical protein
MSLFHNTKLQSALAFPLYQQIYDHLRTAIVEGNSSKGEAPLDAGARR